MATFLYKTRGNSSPERKPRVYFTCHPEDFTKYFEKICEDIFATQDCAVFYTESMTEEIEEKYKESDLGQMNLFVIPVTFKLLSKPNRAMDSDFRYAKEKHIPVLPIMMETGLDSFYSAKDKFGEAQYLSPYVQDMTAISYEEKLKKYLESVLISSEMAERIRKAFDAYIFLSYRKKDRHYANQLMKLIHSHPEFRDIAIWYDEFLTPGESFRANIEKMMQDSKLFTLLVTPNLLEYVDGEPNYVMAHEYPDAKKAGMDILPTEMEETDRTELCSSFLEIPECVDPQENELFKKRLLDSLSKIAISANNNDPEHNFLIGLAYLDGIDVEKNTERGIELITMAAEANLPEAMKKLYNMYNEGKGIQVDYRKAVYWAERIWQYYKEKYGEEHPGTLTALGNLAFTYGNLGDHRKALELQEKVYALMCKILGEEHPDTLNTLNNLAPTYGDLGDHQKALELQEKVYALRCKILGEEHPDTLITLNNLALTYGKLGDHRKALELQEKLYALMCKILGEEHPYTLTTLGNLASTYGKLGDRRKALELNEKVYALQCKILGKEHPDTLTTLSNLAYTYGDLDDNQKALELNEKCYALRCKILGEEHPDTLTTLGNLAYTYGKLGDHRKALELQEKVYALRSKILDE
ncbi:MAG: tetratricopeptide repeat protein [Clostridia bacterium]|nr:tetratricopeptide repeat protein [Clostridia bacterium]